MPDIFRFQNVKIVHFEPTTNCNAACPQCLRTRTEFEPNELSLDDVKILFTPDVLLQLEKIYMCGNYGDPASARQTIEMYEYFKSVNPNLVIGMNTNGGIRYPEWWAKLANIMSGEKDYVVFSIDGLEDTNHLYRRNVRWSKVIENAQAFINAGGKAHWDMLVFEHNKHQVDQAHLIAKQMGFKWFRAKVSRRFTRFPVDGISQPIEFIDNKVTEGYIECSAMKENSIYVDASGKAYPCCWQGENEYQPNIVQWFYDLSENWDTNPHLTCKKSCLKNNVGTTFTNQWYRAIEL
jgi:sulfatase maturation enzyme AslB (radical SAM superfamily)